MLKWKEKMFLNLCLVFLLASVFVLGNPTNFRTEKFRVGIEYDKSLPMRGGSDRYRHRNNYDPFYVTISTTARNGFVLTYLDVEASVDALGEIDFQVVRGQAGSKTMVFQLVSNNSDFLSYSYLAYGMKEAEYKKISNIISLPITNSGWRQRNLFAILIVVLKQILL